jgi:flagellar basal body rod protein FlgB
MLGMIGIITTIVFGSRPYFEALFTSSLMITAFRSICFITAILLSLWLLRRRVNDVFSNIAFDMNSVKTDINSVKTDINSVKKRVSNIEILIKIFDAEKIVKDKFNELMYKNNVDIESERKKLIYDFAIRHDLTITQAEEFINPLLDEIEKKR